MIRLLALWLLMTAAVNAAQRMSEIPTGNVDGSNSSFHLSVLPYPDTLKLYKNGIRLANNVDYTLNSQQIAFIAAPQNGDSLIADYEVLAPAGYHALLSKATNACLTPSSTSKLVSASCSGSDAQKLSATLSVSGYLLTIKSSNQNFDLLNSGTADGTAVVQSAPSTSRGQLWQPISLDNDLFFELTNGLTNGASCLTMSAGSLILQTCTGLDAQKWQWQ